MEQRLSWREICDRYPDEWVGVVDYEDEGRGDVRGVVVTHHPEKEQFYQLLREAFQKYHDIAGRYTGELITESDLPILWRISNTD